jgi:hypothetical protein
VLMVGEEKGLVISNTTNKEGELIPWVRTYSKQQGQKIRTLELCVYY